MSPVSILHRSQIQTAPTMSICSEGWRLLHKKGPVAVATASEVSRRGVARFLLVM